MKTPLHSISAEVGFLSELTSKLEKQSKSIRSSKYKSYVNNYFDETKKLFDHIDGLVQFLVMAINRSQDFVKSTSGVAIKPSLETINIEESVNLIKRIMDHENNQRTIEIHPLPRDLCPTVITDKQFFLDNMLCLVSNACKYSDIGATVHLIIELVGDLDAVEAKQTVLVSVEDNGIGISDENKSSLFQPFKQVQRRTGGTGLGLYSLKTRMEVLGGGCGIKNLFDGKNGSVFWFSFPYRPDIETSPVSTTLTNAANDSDSNELEISVDIPKFKILLVDDVASILKVTSRFLKQNGHDVITAENGSQAMNVLLNVDSPIFDLIITDLQMPVSDIMFNIIYKLIIQ